MTFLSVLHFDRAFLIRFRFQVHGESVAALVSCSLAAVFAVFAALAVFVHRLATSPFTT